MWTSHRWPVWKHSLRLLGFSVLSLPIGPPFSPFFVSVFFPPHVFSDLPWATLRRRIGWGWLRLLLNSRLFFFFLPFFPFSFLFLGYNHWRSVPVLTSSPPELFAHIGPGSFPSPLSSGFFPLVNLKFSFPPLLLSQRRGGSFFPTISCDECPHWTSCSLRGPPALYPPPVFQGSPPF